VSNLAEGSYSLYAVAMASGISGTSGIVNITVTAAALPPSLSSPSASNGLFAFNYSAIPGLTYVVQKASNVNALNVFDWVSVVTNVASSNLVLFSEPLSTDLSHFYRVGRLPGP